MSSRKASRPRRRVKPPSSNDVVDFAATFGISCDNSDSSDSEFKPDQSGSDDSDISEGASEGSPSKPLAENERVMDESDAEVTVQGEVSEEKQSVDVASEGGGESSGPPLKRSRRRTALSVDQVDLNELSAKLGIPLDDDASDSEFEPSAEELASNLDTESSSISENSSGGEEEKKEEEINMDTEAVTTGSSNTISEVSKSQGDRDVLLCAVCLGDSDAGGDIVMCDHCGITVHEGCYGVPDDEGEEEDAKSDVSSFTTIPWFCDPCKAGVKSPVCELCPNTGGLFKETVAGSWVHMVCCLYTPGVEYVSPSLLSGITLDRLPRAKWGAKVCQLCDKTDKARTGVCIGCDAGFCKSIFHVTCAQKDGLLCEAEDKDDDTEIADPYFAHCKLHTDKDAARKAKRAFTSVMSRQKSFTFDTKDERTLQYLEQAKKDYVMSFKKMQDYYHHGMNGTDGLHSSNAGNRKKNTPHKKVTSPKHINGGPLEPLQKVDSSSKRKQTFSYTKKVPPGLTSEFADYYHARKEQIQSLQAENRVLVAANEELRRLEQDTQHQHSQTEERLASAKAEGTLIRGQAVDLYVKLFRLVKKDAVELPEVLRCKENGTKPDKDRDSVEVELNSCVSCKQSRDPHLMVLCDTCRHSYHIGCLDPPLARVPKKSSKWGWQCHECVKSSDSEPSPVASQNNDQRPTLRTSRSGRKIYPPKTICREYSPTNTNKKRLS